MMKISYSKMTCITPARDTAKPPLALAITAVALAVLLLAPTMAYSETASAKYKEYEIKAAFIFNFLKFIDWPKEKNTADNNEIIIGIIGEDPFGPAVDIFKDKTVDDRKVVVKRFEGLEGLKKMDEKSKNEQFDSIRKCYLLFVCPSEQKHAREITEIVAKHAVLTVGDNDQFIESGGMINLFIEDNKIRFDINLAASKKAGLEMRSQLVRLARKVTKDQPNIRASKEGG